VPTLRLGHHDTGTVPSRSALLRVHHDWTSSRRGFRDEATDRWRALEAVAGTSVASLQEGLRRAGFLPHGPVDGVFGYRTRAAVRLFQEYVREVEGRPEIGVPDGVVGPNTHSHLERWQAAGQVAEWARADFSPTAASKLTSTLLTDTLQRIAASPDALTRAVDGFRSPTATLRSTGWSTDASRGIHLIGIRRNAEVGTTTRANDDLFVLLGGGMTFFFLGSTDPNPGQSRNEEPYLVRGQHRYRFGWHKLNPMGRLSDGTVPSGKVYLALRPAVDAGVLVVRDRDRDDALTADDLRGALENAVDINVHWSGRGTSNWSAGCQVIGGARYIGYGNRLVDCMGHASVGYSDLGGRKTRGAYNVMMDALTVAAPQFGRDGTEVLYTLLYEDDLPRTHGLSQQWFRHLVERLAGRTDQPVPDPS